MERKNFYLLLELSVNPPENDSKIIEAAIQKKQAEWSKLRNHPTKATIAQQYIGLLPEIRKVMLDPALRKKEVSALRQMLLQQEHRKFWKLDRHLGILFSKGHVTDREIVKLAELHNISEDKIRVRVKEADKFWNIEKQVEKLAGKGKSDDKKIARLSHKTRIPEDKLRERIAKKEEGIFREIDKYLNICMNRGYITAEEISGLSKLEAVSEDRLLKRIRCPIRKKSKDKEESEPLDSTIAQIIEDKLRVIGKKDLYDFLGISSDSGLEVIQNTARDKEAEIRKIGQKDALTTAGGALAGHCVAIFKTQESRNAYDSSILRKRLGQLDADIEAAESEGKLRGEYLNALMKIALRLGTPPDEAESYIREYCGKRKWMIGQSPQQKKRRMMIAAGIGAAVAAVILICVMIWLFRALDVRSDYQKAVAFAEKQTVLEEKEKILKGFLKEHSKSNYALQTEKKIIEVQNQIKKRDFEAAVQEARKLSDPKEIEKAIAVFEQYLKKYPESIHNAEARQQIARLKDQADDRDFAAIKSFQGDYTEKMKLCDNYFKTYPKGRHTEEAKKIISSMLSGYYNQLKKDLNACEQKEDWNTCIEVCGKFIEKFAHSEQASEVEGFRIRFQKNKQNHEDMSNMRRKAAGLGENYESARLIYSEYLTANPEAPPYMKRLIEEATGELDRQIARRDREKKEWESLLLYCKSAANSAGSKAQKLESYITANPTIRYVDEAKKMLAEFKKQKAVEDERLAAEKEVRDWQELSEYIAKSQTSLADRIRKLEAYLSQNPSGRYSAQANGFLQKLLKEKAVEDERIRIQQAEIARKTAAMREIQALLKQSGGRFRDNGNSTLTDTKTGLTWSMLDSSADLGRCLNYQAAEEYVKSLSTGGHSDWRLPTMNELAGIYKTPPYFPSIGDKWFWSADLFWHGWNKRIYTVNSVKENNWTKQDTDSEQCGTAHAVRRR